MNWDDSDAAKLREYVQKSGNKLRLFLRSRVPNCDGKTIEEVALKARYKEGFEAAIKEIDDMLQNNENQNDPSSGTFISM
jgi:hypothetical protein